MLGLRHEVSYEGQAAVELETYASSHIGPTPDYRFGGTDSEIDPGPVLASILRDLRLGKSTPSIAAGFHRAVAVEVATTAKRLARSTGVDTVALSGGVFQNVTLLGLTRRELDPLGLRVITHRLVPPNDAGLALGQIVSAAAAVMSGRRA